LLLLSLCCPSAAWKTSGWLSPFVGSSLHYVGKFCYDYAHEGKKLGGLLEITVTGKMNSSDHEIINPDHNDSYEPMPPFPPAPGGVYLAIFSDNNETHSEWPEVRKEWKDLNCLDFMKRAAAVRPVTPSLPAGKFEAKVVITDTQRPRFLYFSFVFCRLTEMSNIEPIAYTIHAQNRDAGFQAEFSMDEMGIVYIEIAGAVVFWALTLGSYFNAVLRFGQGALRSRLPLQFLLVSCGLSALGCTCLALNSLAFASDGVGSGMLEVLGEVCACFARVTLSLLQLFMARGRALLGAAGAGPFFRMGFWTRCRQLFLQGLVASIVLLSVGCEVYERYFGDTDWSTTLYFYDSWPGFIILMLNTVLFVEVCVATIELFRRPEREVEVLQLYRASFCASVAYFLALPATCILAHCLEPWDRRRTVVRAEVTVRIIASLMLALWFRPSKLDEKVQARLETPDHRQTAVELTDALAEGVTGNV